MATAAPITGASADAPDKTAHIDTLDAITLHSRNVVVLLRAVDSVFYSKPRDAAILFEFALDEAEKLTALDAFADREPS